MKLETFNTSIFLKTVGCEGAVTLYTALFYVQVKTVIWQLFFSTKQTWRMC